MGSEPPSSPPGPPQPPERPPAQWRPPTPQPPATPPATPPPATPPVAAGYPAATTALRPAGFWIRVVAYVIDIVILAVVNAVVGVIVGQNNTNWGGLLSFLIDLAYFTYFWSQRGQTLGMMALNLRVIRTDGSPLTVGRAVGRYFALILSFLIVFIGVILVAFDARKQGLHDKIVDTLVVHTR